MITTMPALEAENHPATWPRRLSLGVGSPALVYAGVGVMVAGFVSIAMTWGLVAGTLTTAEQLRPLVFGSALGLALVMAGATLVAVAALQRDALERARQIDRLASILGELRPAPREDVE